MSFEVVAFLAIHENNDLKNSKLKELRLTEWKTVEAFQPECTAHEGVPQQVKMWYHIQGSLKTAIKRRLS